MSLTTTQRYCFEVEGFLHLPSVLTPSELVGARADSGQLATHPLLMRHIADAFGSGVANIAANGMTGGSDLQGGFSVDTNSNWLGRAAPGALFPSDQHYPDGEKLCYGIGAVWALQQASLIVVPASHKSTLAAPTCVLSGEDTLDTTKTIHLSAGDVLLSCATLLQTLVEPTSADAILHYCYLHNDAFRPSDPSKLPSAVEMPSWTHELTPEQQAIVGMRTIGTAPIVKSDGTRVWTAPRPPPDPGRGGTILQPPSLFSRATDGMIDHTQAWLYDLRGFVLLKSVMDEGWLHDANTAFDAHGYDPENIRLVPEACLRDNGHVWPTGTSEKLQGVPAPGPGQAAGEGAVHRPRFGGLYTLPDPHCKPFRRMIAHPPVVQTLNWLLGFGFNESFEPMACIYPPGTCGGSMHAAPRTYNAMGGEGFAVTTQAGYDKPVAATNPFAGGVNTSRRAALSASVGATCPLTGASTGYSLTNGRFYSEGVNVSWALDGASGADGGFVTIIGGHKARFPYQGEGTEFPDEATAIDHPLCQHIALAPGDVIIFNARSTPHGVLAWHGEHERRCVIQFYNPRNARLTPGQKLGTPARNEAQVNGGTQAPPGWDLSESGFRQMWDDLGITTQADYLAYKRGPGFGTHVSRSRL